MAKKSKNPTKSGVTPVPKLGRKSGLPTFVQVPCPPEVARWQRGGASVEPYRQLSQERAQEITGRSRDTVRRWATGRQAIDSSSLRLLQVWVWGIIPAAPFIEAGIFIAHNQRWHHTYDGTPQDLIATDAGYLITPRDLDSFGWLRGVYQDHWNRQQAATAEDAPPLPSAEIIPFEEHLARRRRRRDTGTDQA